MAPLPLKRLVTSLRAFTKIAVDFGGPKYKVEAGEEKSITSLHDAQSNHHKKVSRVQSQCSNYSNYAYVITILNVCALIMCVH